VNAFGLVRSRQSGRFERLLALADEAVQVRILVR
jgi:hypothetical protein